MEGGVTTVEKVSSRLIQFSGVQKTPGLSFVSLRQSHSIDYLYVDILGDKVNPLFSPL